MLFKASFISLTICFVVLLEGAGSAVVVFQTVWEKQIVSIYRGWGLFTHPRLNLQWLGTWRQKHERIPEKSIWDKERKVKAVSHGHFWCTLSRCHFLQYIVLLLTVQFKSYLPFCAWEGENGQIMNKMNKSRKKKYMQSNLVTWLCVLELSLKFWYNWIIVLNPILYHWWEHALLPRLFLLQNEISICDRTLNFIGWLKPLKKKSRAVIFREVGDRGLGRFH